VARIKIDYENEHDNEDGLRDTVRLRSYADTPLADPPTRFSPSPSNTDTDSVELRRAPLEGDRRAGMNQQ
jgi:hypothetical protein